MDYYETRTGNEKIVDRACRIGGSEFYMENGFEVFRGAILGCVRDLQDFAKDALRDDFFKSKEPGGNGVRSVLGFQDRLDWFLRSPKIEGLVKNVIGDDYYIHQCRINYKSGTSSNGWRWHSDFETWHYSDGMPRMNCFTMMVPLQENTPFNGPLTVIPGSHKRYVSCASSGEFDPESEFSDQKAGLPSDNAILQIANGVGYKQILCRPGDIVVFDCNLMHGSAAPLDPSGRANMFLVFNAKDNALQKPFGGKERPIEMAARFTS